jgi:hypothetical protein
VVTIGPPSSKEDALFAIENVLGDSAFGTTDQCRLSDIFDISNTNVVEYKDLTQPEKETKEDYVIGVKKSIAASRAFMRHAGVGVKLTR